ncbi:MAG: hypothetical protein J3Q66DRAFT_437724 [Benniella sp.]|nr:MAG: hypothetical protein J3Q66DRAFT_437724 [Benniella sp.]
MKKKPHWPQMLSRCIVPAPKNPLSSQQALRLSNMYLENATRTVENLDDHDITLVLCHNMEVALSRVKGPKKADDAGYQTMLDEMNTAYTNLSNLLERLGYLVQSQTFRNKAEKWRKSTNDSVRPKRQLFGFGSNAQLTTPGHNRTVRDAPVIPKHIFSENVGPPTLNIKLPGPDERLASTPQLVCCLGLLQTTLTSDDKLEPAARKWLETIEKDPDEQERLKLMAQEIVRTFKRDEFKDAKAVAEVVYLAPVLSKEAFRDLLDEFHTGIKQSDLTKFHQLEGLAHLIQGADPGYLEADDLVKILELLSNRLQATHWQSSQHVHQLTLAVSQILDAMADTNVTGLDREALHEPLLTYLRELKGSKDPYLVYQAEYAFQALLCVPDDETKWQSAMRRTGKVIQGVSRLVSAARGLDLNMFIKGLEEIQEGASKAFETAMEVYDKATKLIESGQGLLDSLQEGFSYDQKRKWYSALRGADVLIRDGDFLAFKELVYKAPCRLDQAFQWGVCQRLGEIAVNQTWDLDTRRDAITFLGEIYKDDIVWGRQASIKQRILDILMQLASRSEGGLKLHIAVAETQLEGLKESGDAKKQVLYRECRQCGPGPYPLKVSIQELASPSLLDRVQNIPDVDTNIRMLRTQRIKGRVNTVYISPLAKSSVQSADENQFDLMEKVKEFLKSERKVFLILGDSGAGKSTFMRELENHLWELYKAETGQIPIHINLPSIDKPEHDFIAKQLRRADFTEPQIREMKHHRKVLLICDGYDESQQTHNLYVSNQLNQRGEWEARMIISCRTEYLGADYQDRFIPVDDNQKSNPSWFQEAVIVPFSRDQVNTYVEKYVSINRPVWRLEDYTRVLNNIPTLKELVRNPFLMALSLDVLPHMVDPGQDLSTAHITRVGLYDHFVRQWMERGKKRIAEKDLTPQARTVFDRLSDEGFAQNGIDFMKRLAVAIYKEQGGKPVVEYSQFMDEGSWKDAFFLRDDKQLLREACPLTRNGNQHRFIHRSLLEYGLARSVFDPYDRRHIRVPEPVKSRRGSIMSIDSQDGFEHEATPSDQEPDINSPLVWRTYVNDHSLLQFLEERVRQQPTFKKQLLSYIEHSKRDPKWRKAAANAITILVRAGEQFVEAPLQGIQIPRADLSYGVFDSANLQGADLRRVNFRGAWLRQTDMSKAQMACAQFGELPFLTEDSLVRSCAFSPDGKSLAVGLENGNVSIYMISHSLEWNKVRTLTGHTELIWCVAFSPKGDQIASCSRDNTVRLWASSTGSLQRTLTSHTDWVRCIAYSPEGNLLASASDDRTIRLWNADTGECSQTLSGHTNWVQCIAYSPKSKHIASGSSDRTVRIWSLGKGKCRLILSGHENAVWAIGYSPQGGQIASASQDQTVRLWDVRTGSCSHILSGHINIVYSVVYSPKGDQIASGSADTTVRLWDAETGRCRHILKGHSDTVMSVAYSPDGNQIASGSFDKAVRLWDVSAGVTRFVSSGHNTVVNSVKCSPTGTLIASGSTDWTIQLWDVDTRASRGIMSGHGNSVSSIAFSPQGDKIVSGSTDRTVRLWDVETGTCLHVLNGHSNFVQCVAYSPQENMFASASADKTVKLWDVEAGQDKTLRGHTDQVLSVVYAPDGTQVASCSMDKTARIWNAGSGECLQILIGHTNWVRDVAFSPHGDQLASAGYDKTIRLWSVAEQESRFILKGHDDRVRSIAFSYRGDLLASGSWDKTVRLWDVVSGECRSVIRNMPSVINSVAWSTTFDASFLVTGSGDGSVLKWKVVREGASCIVYFDWSVTNGTLAVTGACIEGVRGLTGVNKQLLRQRGAIGEPLNLFHDSSKNSAEEAQDSFIGEALAKEEETQRLNLVVQLIVEHDGEFEAQGIPDRLNSECKERCGKNRGREGGSSGSNRDISDITTAIGATHPRGASLGSQVSRPQTPTSPIISIDKAKSAEHQRNLVQSLKSAILNCRRHGEQSVQCEPTESRVSETLTQLYCDSTPMQSLKIAGHAGDLDFYIHKNCNKDDIKTKENVKSLKRFAKLLVTLAKDVFGLKQESIHVMYDTEGPTIAFNRAGSLFFNWRFYVSLGHDESEGSTVKRIQGKQSVTARDEGLIYWFFTIAHELAHNFVTAHDSKHEYYMSSFCEQYLLALIAVIMVHPSKATA